MDLLERIRADIPDFAGYQTQEQRRRSDEQIRAFVGEQLAAMTGSGVEEPAPERRALYDRLMFRCEFMNQMTFRPFDDEPDPDQIARTLEADATLAAAAKSGDLEEIERAFDARDEAMQRR